MLSSKYVRTAVACVALASASLCAVEAGPLARVAQSVTRALTVLQVPGSGGPTTSAGPLLSGSGSAQPAATIFGAIGGVGQSQPVSTAGLSIAGDNVRLDASNGETTDVTVDAATAQRLQWLAGKRVVVTTGRGGTVTVAPAFAQLAGTIVATHGTTTTIRTPDGTLVPIDLPHARALRLGLRPGSVVSALTKDGGKTIVAYIAPAPGSSRTIHYLGRVVAQTRASVTLLTADGLTHMLRCSPCNERLAGLGRRAVYVAVSRTGQIVGVAPLSEGTRIAGIVVGLQSSTIALLTGSADVLMLDCACGTLSVPSASGTPVLADVGADGTVTSAWPYPPSRHVTGRVVAISATTVTLRLSDSKVMQFYCRCAGNRLGNVRLRDGMELSAQLDGEGWLQTLGSADYLADDCSVNSGTLVDVRVRNARTALPIYHAAVALSGPFGTTWLTSQDGSIEFDGAPPGTYRLSASKGGFALETSQPFTLRCHQGLAANFSLTAMSTRRPKGTHSSITPVHRHELAARNRRASRCAFVSTRDPASRRFACLRSE